MGRGIFEIQLGKVNQKIHMVDLVGQHAKIQAELDEAIGRVMATGAFVKGPEVAAFAGNWRNLRVRSM